MLENWKKADTLWKASDQDKVLMSSANVAKLFNLNIGKIEVGYDANILVMDDNNDIVSK